MKYPIVSPLFVLIFITLASCFTEPKTQNDSTSKTTTLRQVIKITDGDTFYVSDSTEKGEKIRIIGVDAPESRNMFKLKKEPFGKEATQYLAGLIENKQVRLEYDVDEKDQYQRTLAYVFLEDNTFVNAELVKNGYAQIMTIPPNVKYADLFYELQVEARNNKRGIWAIDPQWEEEE